MSDNSVFFGTIIEQSSLYGRLMDGLFDASREFRRDPRAYLRSALRGDGAGGRRRQSLLKMGLAIGLIFYSVFFLTLMIAWSVSRNHPPVSKSKPERGDLTPPIWLPRPPETAKKAEQDSESHGGGSGGRESRDPATGGELPPFSFAPPLNAPTTRPTLSPPSLPMAEVLFGNPQNSLKRDELAPTGIPGAPVGPPSDGPGKGGGIGDKNGGGIGSGNGPGFGPGDGGNTGGERNNYALNGRRPNGTNAENRVDEKPVALNRPRPNYTEEARLNKVQGVVGARVLVGADGAVKRVQIRGAGLPNGLNEEAIRAASQMRFRPAMKDGQPVAYWVTIEIEFNIR